MSSRSQGKAPHSFLRSIASGEEVGGDPTWKNACDCRSWVCAEAEMTPPRGTKGVLFRQGSLPGPPKTQEIYTGRRGHWSSSEFQGCRKQEKLSYRLYLQLKESSVTGQGRAAHRQPQGSEQTPWSENYPLTRLQGLGLQQQEPGLDAAPTETIPLSPPQFKEDEKHNDVMAKSISGFI